MRFLSAVLGLLVLAPSASGLASLTHDDQAPALRVHVEGDEIQARAIEGTPSIQGRALTGNWTTLEDVGIEPWRGYDRTAQLRYGGNGTILLADGESGLWLQPGAPDASDRRAESQEESNRSQGNDTEEGGRDPTAPGSAGDDRSDTRRSARPTEADNASATEAAEPGTMQEDAGPEPSSPDSEDAEGPSLLVWGGLLLGVAVGVGPWALDLARKRLRRLGSTHDGGDGADEPPPSEDPSGGSGDAPYPWLSPGSRRGGRR